MSIASRKTIKELEFDQILEQVSALAASEPGRKHVLALEPSADRARVVEEVEAVDEARRLLGEYRELKSARRWTRSSWSACAPRARSSSRSS